VIFSVTSSRKARSRSDSSQEAPTSRFSRSKSLLALAERQRSTIIAVELQQIEGLQDSFAHLGFFSKLTRSVLRHIRIASKQELRDRLMAAVDHFNGDPGVHTWTYKLDKAA
jgi:hypothetical protein